MKPKRVYIEPCKVESGKEYCHLKKLEYFQPNIVRLDLPFILTENKMLVFGMQYLKLEGSHIDAVRLLDVWDKDGYVYLKFANIKTGFINTISWLLDYNGDYWLWSLTSLSILTGQSFHLKAKFSHN